ncbi:LacI family DNA-binding transcriptional regulator [Ornithinicoccus halotolerans]|uniref:LacI family DNA-binding transcriptional regulator n=1 Tax=Ornithinicoccus halotolerans TaxID=1748220 RepID=UPI0012963087|nr:LacI family DNA-binding transcriptional regulator [Ornithinicoccus halotolerans]
MVDDRQGAGADRLRANDSPAGLRARLSDVAAEANVTKSVASRVLNQDPTLKVREETRARVAQAAERLGYQPHSGARALASGEAGALALLLPDLSNPVFSRILRGAFVRALARHYMVVVVEEDPGVEATEQVTDLVRSGRVDGLLIGTARPGHPLFERDLAAFPHVFVNRPVAGSHRNVYLDFREASALAVEHLLSLGHRRLAHIAGPVDVTSAHEREKGYQAALASHGLGRGPVVHGTFDEEGGAEATSRLLRRHPEVTGVYVSSLTQAVGVLHAARALGRPAPGGLSVISFDDSPLARYLDPPLTCVSTSLEELGERAVDALISQLEGQLVGDVVISGQSNVVRRQSTAPV